MKAAQVDGIVGHTLAKPIEPVLVAKGSTYVSPTSDGIWKTRGGGERGEFWKFLGGVAGGNNQPPKLAYMIAPGIVLGDEIGAIINTP